MLIKSIEKGFKSKIFVLGKTGESQWEKKFKEDISHETILLIDKTSIEETAVLIQ